MRGLVGVLMAVLVLGMGFWAYRENYKTRALLEDVSSVQSEIVSLQKQLAVERAEWAWLNRPDRLRALVVANKDRLDLTDMGPEHFGTLSKVAKPVRDYLAAQPELTPVAINPSEQTP